MQRKKKNYLIAGPGLNAFSSGWECGVPILGDGCILLYGDIFGFPGDCKIAFALLGIGLCAINGLGECIGLPMGDWADICIIFVCWADGDDAINVVCDWLWPWFIGDTICCCCCCCCC